jgi:hypothetical protein
VTPEEVPATPVRTFLKATCGHCALTVGREPVSSHEQEARRILAAVLPLHEQQVRERVAAEQEQERKDAFTEAERKFRAVMEAAPRNGALRVLPDGALAWYRRAPEERRVYLTKHRVEAMAYGIPADLVDLMIGDAEENADD